MTIPSTSVVDAEAYAGQVPRLPWSPAAVTALMLDGPREEDQSTSRLTIARAVLAVVAAWCYDETLYAGALLGFWPDEDGPLDPANPMRRTEQFDLTDPVMCEEQVRVRAEDVEGTSLGAGTGGVVCGALADLYLLDDYQRIKAVEQHYTFGVTGPTPDEDDAHTRHLHRKAELARESAARARQRLIDNAQLCTCGETRAMHGSEFTARRASLAASVTTMSSTPRRCRSFSALADRAMGPRVASLLDQVMEPWAMSRRVDLDAHPEQAARFRELVTRLPDLPGPSAATVYEALDAAWNIGAGIEETP